MKRSYLLSNAIVFKRPLKPVGMQCNYDAAEDMNMITVDSVRMPFVLTELAPPTHSKTAAAPGDDDPDIECEKCY